MTLRALIAELERILTEAGPDFDTPVVVERPGADYRVAGVYWERGTDTVLIETDAYPIPA